MIEKTQNRKILRQTADKPHPKKWGFVFFRPRTTPCDSSSDFRYDSHFSHIRRTALPKPI
jgi:hypothetical protein